MPKIVGTAYFDVSLASGLRYLLFPVVTESFEEEITSYHLS